jgi:putative alpha-1,2-mannosidase
MHAEQARCLCHHVIADAWYRRIDGIDYRTALDLMVADILKPRHADFTVIGTTSRATFALDMADACFATAQIASGLGDTTVAADMMVFADRWRSAYDPATGLLTAHSTYYEGTLWNYSFRLLHNMADRIALAGGDVAFISLLESFFGYEALTASDTQALRRDFAPADDYVQYGFSLGRFEGFNNEPDMETPYAFLYAGRPDRTAEVLRAAARTQFTTGPGGLPGNDDSGGLSSCYVWNAIGLFPVTGQPVMLIGSGLYARVSLTLPGGDFEIFWENNSDANIYVQSATLNGVPLHRAWLHLDEFLSGGQLCLTMDSTPSTWATALDQRPPSWGS